MLMVVRDRRILHVDIVLIRLKPFLLLFLNSFSVIFFEQCLSFLEESTLCFDVVPFDFMPLLVLTHQEDLSKIHVSNAVVIKLQYLIKMHHSIVTYFWLMPLPSFFTQHLQMNSS